MGMPIDLFQSFIPTAAQWQGYFDSKQDVLGNPAPNNFLIGSGTQWQPQSLQNVQNLLGLSTFKLLSHVVDFNAGNTDTVFPVALPAGITRYLVDSVRISGASHTLVTATAGLFTAAAGAGVAIVTGASAITVATAAEDTNNNAMAFTVNNLNTQSYDAPNLYFRVGTAEGAAALATVTIVIRPLS